MSKRTTFGTKLGVIATAVGSAVGLGNIWRFPYELGQNGGGAFMLIYLGFVICLGVPLIIAEFTLGRAARSNVSGTFEKLAPKTLWKHQGYLSVLCCLLILGFYTVIAGWTLEYIWQAVTNSFSNKDAQTLTVQFTEFSTSTYRPILWLSLFLAMNYYIIVGGVKNGIEKASNIMMPLLFVLLLVFSVRGIFLPGAAEGFTFLFKPDFSKITHSTLLSAMGQAFFSLSLGMGCLITYGSYFRDDVNLVKTATTVAILDTLVAVLAGVMIFPAVFTFGISPSAGPDLVFITLPNVFEQMPGGYIWSILFFILLATAALTSTVSMFEVVTAFVTEEFKVTRAQATIGIVLVTLVLATACSLSIGPWAEYKIFGKNIFDTFDSVTSNYLMPLGGLIVSLFMGYRLDKGVRKGQITNHNTNALWAVKPVVFILRYFAPVAIVLIFLAGLGIVK